MDQFGSTGNTATENGVTNENAFGRGSDAMEPYPYSDMIKKPNEIGVSDEGNLRVLSNDIKAIQGYVNVLMSGNSNAQHVSPMGNQYFLDTQTQCKDQTGILQARYAYVNNIPDNSMIGRGMVSGIIQDIAAIDPSSLFNAFSAKEDKCQKITMSTRDNTNTSGTESRYVNNADIAKYNPCWFPERRNPVTQTSCEGMTNRQMLDVTNRNLPDDPIVKIYMAGVGAIVAFMVYRFMKK